MYFYQNGKCKLLWINWNENELEYVMCDENHVWDQIEKDLNVQGKL